MYAYLLGQANNNGGGGCGFHFAMTLSTLYILIAISHTFSVDKRITQTVNENTLY